jgi:small subunit ribosomal protein S6
MNQKVAYETVFILTPVLSDEQTKEAVEFYRKTLKDNGAKITNEEHWGLRKLAYPIEKKSTGFYHVIQFEAPGATVRDLEITYHRDERILRFLTVSLDKHALAYLEKRKLRFGKKENKSEKNKAESTVSQ